MFIERTNYYANPGAREQVLALRRRASEVRVAIGLAPGTIFVSAGGDGPDVAWSASFPTLAAREADMAARGASPDFEAVRREMGKVLARFERIVERRDEATRASGMGDVNLAGQQIVAREIEFQSGPRRLKGYLHVPPGPGPFPCMITNHGSGIDQGTSDVCRPGTASWLMSWGVASFLPHRQGYGNSPGTPWREEVSAAFGTAEYDVELAARLDRESGDILAALDAVAARPEIRADRIGVMGSSFGGTTTLLAAAKSPRARCAVEFAGAAMNWDRTPGLRRLMLEAAQRLTRPIFFIQAANDYSIRPTLELAKSLEGGTKIVQSKIYPAHGLTSHEGHLFESTGQLIWGEDVRAFLERYL